jgi:hypothetical protein
MVIGYMLLFSWTPFPGRLFLAAGVTLAVYFFGVVGFYIAHTAANWLLGGRNSADLPNPQEMLAGLLLFTAVWILWQFNRDSTVLELAPCVDRYVSEEEYRPGEAVTACYRDRGGWDDFSAE